MKPIKDLIQYIKPYWKESLAALLLLSAAVGMDLIIPRLIQRIVDQGVTLKDMSVVTSTALLMLGLTVLSVFFAIGNSVLSVLVGEGFARDLRQVLFVKIQGLSFGNLDHLQTGELIVRLTSDVTQVQRLAQVLLRIGVAAYKYEVAVAYGESFGPGLPGIYSVDSAVRQHPVGGRHPG